MQRLVQRVGTLLARVSYPQLFVKRFFRTPTRLTDQAKPALDDAEPRRAIVSALSLIGPGLGFSRVAPVLVVSVHAITTEANLTCSSSNGQINSAHTLSHSAAGSFSPLETSATI